MHSLWHSSLHLSANYRISEDQLPLVWVLGIVLWLFFFCLKKENKQQNKPQKNSNKKPKTLSSMDRISSNTYILTCFDSFRFRIIVKRFPYSWSTNAAYLLQKMSQHKFLPEKKSQLWKLVILETLSCRSHISFNPEEIKVYFDSFIVSNDLIWWQSSESNLSTQKNSQ